MTKPHTVLLPNETPTNLHQREAFVVLKHWWPQFAAHLRNLFDYLRRFLFHRRDFCFDFNRLHLWKCFAAKLDFTTAVGERLKQTKQLSDSMRIEPKQHWAERIVGNTLNWMVHRLIGVLVRLWVEHYWRLDFLCKNASSWSSPWKALSLLPLSPWIPIFSKQLLLLLFNGKLSNLCY